ncbi:MAG TPA: hypothetical protein VK066_20335 [Chloroflexota bacterium]|nr:hypothetical protein [Chloroflexota bacterium]
MNARDIVPPPNGTDAAPVPEATGRPAAPPLATPAPQWGEAYLLFDGDYRSLDDLLRSLDS